jgi:hypothetical protein
VRVEVAASTGRLMELHEHEVSLKGERIGIVNASVNVTCANANVHEHVVT